jgi:nucleoid DNA-binding protein
MNKNEILDEIKKKTNVNKKDIEIIFDAMVEIFRECFRNGIPISIRYVGSFKFINKPSYKKYIPAFEEFRIVPAKKIIKFTPSEALLDSINKESEVNDDE